MLSIDTKIDDLGWRPWTL